MKQKISFSQFSFPSEPPGETAQVGFYILHELKNRKNQEGGKGKERNELFIRIRHLHPMFGNA